MVLFQVPAEVLLEVQSKLFEKCRKPTRHAEISSFRIHGPSRGRHVTLVSQREHVRAQQQQARP